MVTSYNEQPYPIQKAIIILSENKNENKENTKIRVLLTACLFMANDYIPCDNAELLKWNESTT